MIYFFEQWFNKNNLLKNKFIKVLVANDYYKSDTFEYNFQNFGLSLLTSMYPAYVLKKTEVKFT